MLVVVVVSVRAAAQTYVPWASWGVAARREIPNRAGEARQGEGGPIAGVGYGMGWVSFGGLGMLVLGGRGQAGEVVTRKKEVGEWEIGRCVVRGVLGVGAGCWTGEGCSRGKGGMDGGCKHREGCGVIVVVGRSRWGVVGFVARRDWLPFDDRDCQAVILERRRAVALSSAQLERARDFDTGRYLQGRKSRQNACCLVGTSGEEEEADKPLRLDGYAGGRDV